MDNQRKKICYTLISFPHKWTYIFYAENLRTFRNSELTTTAVLNGDSSLFMVQILIYLICLIDMNVTNQK